ncbi:zinc finger protein 578-like isoform X2 [Branchiostoma floridae]|uniref:Zinc finger protein 578-like isoform X2 n=1 Tax=Branchiostoma floridae TaxID=7739 RepID=A0A9J7MDZ3_BRAFL|nr:zinc finger protein 578-like isoform X2 [Branchiostoma floridae]
MFRLESSMSRQQEFICGLSHEVTIAVLPRLTMDELMIELNRRVQNMDKENSIKDRLINFLRDVMLEEYRQLERVSEVSSPEETSIPLRDQETATMQENVLSAYTETMLSETSSPDTSQQSSGLDIVIKKERSDLFVPQFDTAPSGAEQVQLTVPQQDQLCNIPSPLTGSPTIPSCEIPLTQMNTITDSCIKEEDVAMPTEDEAVRACHGDLNIHTPISRSQEPDTLNLMNTSTCSRTDSHVESDTCLASCQLPPNHGYVHTCIKMEYHVSEDDQNAQISQPSNPVQTEHYTDDRDTGIINSGHEKRQTRKDSSEETPLAPCQPTSNQDCESMATLRPDNDSQIGSKRHMCELKTSFVNSSFKRRKRNKGEKPFTCGECGYRARHQRRLVEHMRTHTGEKPFKCNQCNYKTSFKTNLGQHMKRHTDAEPYSCELCDYQTYRKSHIERHMMGHSGVKSYKCEECEYRTADKANFYRHSRLHTGEKPYSCQECDYKARQKFNLLRHVKRKHL